ncbi:MAG TPA: NAD(P)-dependent oxidoreductase [Spirochaetota bacterium]|nr:NAD(P)-dependent oxidoreductase [Spirochaetota bacterium]
MKLLITDDFYPQLLSEFPNVFEVTHKPKISYEELKDQIFDYEILIISTRIKITEELLNNARKLKLIIRLGIGVDHIDLKTCQKKKIIVCNTPNSNISSVVELVYGQIIRHYRHLEIADNNLYNGNFRKEYTLGKELKNKTIGIIGVGRIGKEVAKVAKVFGMKTIGYDPYLSKSKKDKTQIDNWLPMDSLIINSNIVTLHVPHTNETHHLVDNNFLSKMKNNSIFINCARGKVVNFKDILEFSKKGIVSKFIIDVFEEEPIKIESDEYTKRYFYFSPHIGALTEESLYNRSKEALEMLNEFITGIKPHGKINYNKGY